jgi:hypothetical protein
VFDRYDPASALQYNCKGGVIMGHRITSEMVIAADLIATILLIIGWFIFFN